MFKSLTLFAVLGLSSLAFSQTGVRVGDAMPVTQVESVDGLHNLVGLIPNASISFCGAPANGVPCTNKVVTYTDATLVFTCPTSTQVVLATTNTCTGSTYAYGNWGVWVPAGQYTYTITQSNGKSQGPFPITAGGSSGGGGNSGNPNQVVAFSNASSATVNVSGGLPSITWACWDNSMPANAIEPASVTFNTSTLVATFSFAIAQSGYCVINTTGGSGSSGGFTPSAPGPIGGVTPSTARFTQLGNTIQVDGFPAFCTVNSVAYTTQLDCAFYTAIQNGNSAVVLGATPFSTPYTTCAGLVEPALGAQVSIIGLVEGDNVQPSEIKATCAMQAVISHPDISSSASSPYNMSIHNVNIDANNQAQQCVALYAEKVGHSEHVHCRNALSSTLAWMQFGDPNPGGGFQGVGYQYDLTDLFVTGKGNGPSSWATLTASQSGGTPSIVVNTPGTYINAAPPAYLFGFGSTQNPCSTMGTATAVMSGAGPYTLSSVTLTGFSGCSGTIYAYVPDIAPSLYGIETAMTDSTFTDLAVNNVGRTAGIHHNNGSNVILHDHAYGGMLVDILDSANNIFVGEEPDSPIHYGIEDDNGKAEWFGTKFLWAGNVPYPGASGFFQGAANLNIYGNDCGGATVNSNGFNLVVTSSGPIAHGPGVAYNGNVVGGVQCDNLANVTYFPTPTIGTASATQINMQSSQITGTTYQNNTSSNAQFIPSSTGPKVATSQAGNTALTITNSNASPTQNLTQWVSTAASVALVGPLGQASFPGYQFIGTTFSVSGCSAGTLVGGSTGGSFLTGASGACTATITLGGGVTAVHDLTCWASDRTTGAGNPISQGTAGASTTTATLAIPAGNVSGDKISFGCMAF